MHTPKSGFSLVELSIVLVILGLLVGGVLSGQSLIRAAEIRAISTEYQRYTAAAQTFKDKYMALPGDMPNATKFWDVYSTDSATCFAGKSTDKKTCDGNGSGVVELSAHGVGHSVDSTSEVYRFWQHMANAGLVEGQYTGASENTTPGNAGSVAGKNVPASRLGKASWSVYTIFGTGNTSEVGVDLSDYFEGSYGNVFMFGIGSSSTTSEGAVIKPEEAWSVDKKIDDGKPGLGLVVSRESQAGTSASTGCSDTASSTSDSIASTSEYSLGNGSVACALIFRRLY